MARKAFGGFLVMAAIGLIAVGGFGVRDSRIFLAILPAQVGVTLGVAPNPYNTLNAQLDAKQAQINAEQANLDAQQAALDSSTAGAASPATGGSPLFGYLVIAVGILALLVGLNFYFDWLRSRTPRQISSQS